MHTDFSFSRGGSATQRPIAVLDSYPTTLHVDDRTIDIRVKAFTLDEYSAFTRDFAKAGRISKRDQLFLDQRRKPVIDRETGEPQKETRVVDGVEKTVTVFEDDATVLARIELEETDDERAKREGRDAADEEFSRKFTIESITRFVSVEPRQLVDANDESLTTGEDLLRRYAARQDVLSAVLEAIYLENVLSDEQKKTLRSLRDSQRSSIEPTSTTAGASPAPTAPPADAPDGAASAAATSHPPTLCGTTARSKSSRARSSRSSRSSSARFSGSAGRTK